jgi:hypothetical protein
VSEVYQASETAQPAIETGATAPYDAGTGPVSADNPGSYPDAAPGDDFAGYSDADIDAILAAEDQLPEPRTRQEAAADTWDNSPDDPAGKDGGLDTSADTTGPRQPDASTGPPVPDHQAEDGTPDPYEHQASEHTTDGTDVPVTAEHLPPEARTVGDTTPTGIGRKPTGAEIFDMEGDDPGESRLDRLLKEVTDDADDARDAATNIAETTHDLRLPGPALGGGHAYEGHPVSDPPPSVGPGYSDLVGSAVLVGVAMLTGIRYGFRQLGKGDRR